MTPPPDLPPPDVAAAPAAVATELLGRLRETPHDFGFFALLRTLEALHTDRPGLGRSLRPEQDALRLGQEPAVTHAPASLASWEPGRDGRPDRLLVHIFGLFGPDGPLPMHLTEHARERRDRHQDAAFGRFADLFHHRALSLFYRAWADTRPTVSFDRPARDRFGMYVGALIGLSTPFLRDRDAMPDLTKLHFAGHLTAQTRHADGLAAVLSAFFTMPVSIEGFCGAWLSLPASDRTRLGTGPDTTELGRTAVVGERVFSRQQKFRIVIGPLDLVEYERLLPDGTSFHKLVPLVRNYAGDVLIWDVNLILRRDEVPAIRLGAQGRLGWTTWLLPRPAAVDAADLFLDASAVVTARGKERSA